MHKRKTKPQTSCFTQDKLIPWQEKNGVSCTLGTRFRSRP